MLHRLGWPRPVRSTVVVAVMVAEEGTDPVRAEISDTVLSVAGHDYRVRKHNLFPVDAPLEITQDKLAAGDVIAKVTQSLHDFSPGHGDVAPSSVAVEFFIVLDKWLNQYFLAGPITCFPGKHPNLGNIDFDGLGHCSQSVEMVDELEGFVHGLDIECEEIIGKHGTSFEPLKYAFAAFTRPISIRPTGDQAKRALRKGVP